MDYYEIDVEERGGMLVDRGEVGEQQDCVLVLSSSPMPSPSFVVWCMRRGKCVRIDEHLSRFFNENLT